MRLRVCAAVAARCAAAVLMLASLSAGYSTCTVTVTEEEPSSTCPAPPCSATTNDTQTGPTEETPAPDATAPEETPASETTTAPPSPLPPPPPGSVEPGSDPWCLAVSQASAAADANQSTAASRLSGLWANDGGDKVTRNELRAGRGSALVYNRLWNGSQISLTGAKNEVVAFNLVLEAQTGASHVEVFFDLLQSSTGAMICSASQAVGELFNWTHRDIELFFVRYLPIKGLSLLAYENYDERHVPLRLRRPWAGEGRATGGWTDRPDHDKYYPDIAVPLERVASFDIPAGSNQSIWADVYIPKTIPAGLYRGRLRILENGALTKTVPVELTVYNFTLPDAPSSKTMVYLSAENIHGRYLGNRYPNAPSDVAKGRLIRDRHFMLAHRHRISLIGDDYTTADQPPAEWQRRLNGTLFTAANGYDGPGVGVGNDVYSIGTYGHWSWQSGTQADMQTHANNWVTWFESNAPQVEYFLYLIDESTNYVQTEQWASSVRRASAPGQRLKTLATCPAPVCVVQVPSLDIYLSTMDVGVTTQWQNAVDSIKTDPRKRFGMYNGKRPASGSFATEDDGVALRQLPWGQYKKGVARWFYWESTYYYNYQGGMGETNVFAQAHTFGTRDRVDPVRGETGWNYTNGDGVLFYPGTDALFSNDSYGLEGPLASLRLKLWRRGIQDVDYLTMAAQKAPERVRAIVERLVPKVLWEYGVADPADPTWVRTDISWPRDADVWEAARVELAAIILGGVDPR